MFSRYDAMSESLVKDEEDQTTYPDPLSVNFNKTQLTNMPKLRDLNDADLSRFWIYMQKNYSMAEADDILLTLNNIPYRGMLQSGDQIYLLDSTDLYNFNSQQKPS